MLHQSHDGFRSLRAGPLSAEIFPCSWRLARAHCGVQKGPNGGAQRISSPRGRWAPREAGSAPLARLRAGFSSFKPHCSVSWDYQHRHPKPPARPACHTNQRADKALRQRTQAPAVGSQAGRDRNGQADMLRVPTASVPLLERRGRGDPPAPLWVHLKAIYNGPQSRAESGRATCGSFDAKYRGPHPPDFARRHSLGTGSFLCSPGAVFSPTSATAFNSPLSFLGGVTCKASLKVK